MNLVFPQYYLDIEFKENQVNVLTVENHMAFTEILEDIWGQYCGGLGTAILSNDDKVLKISREAEVVFNIFDVNVNDKKILSKIYTELTQNANELLIEKTAKVNSLLIEYLDLVLQTVPYNLSQELSIDINGLLKLYNVKVEDESSTILEKLIDYVKLAHQALNKELFIFVNLKQFLPDDNIKNFYEMIKYEKVHVLIIEGVASEKVENEYHQVLDKDLCIINY